LRNEIPSKSIAFQNVTPQHCFTSAVFGLKNDGAETPECWSPWVHEDAIPTTTTTTTSHRPHHLRTFFSKSERTRERFSMPPITRSTASSRCRSRTALLCSAPQATAQRTPPPNPCTPSGGEPHGLFCRGRVNRWSEVVISHCY